MKGSTLLIVVAIVAGVAVLCALGSWQVYRLQWKEALIAQVESRIASPPVALARVEERWDETRDVDFQPVQLYGTFDHSAEQYYYNTYKGQAGWNVYTPLRLEDGRTALVNRGFVPEPLRDPSTRVDGLLQGVVELTGLARNPPAGKPNSFMPDNEPQKHTFFWKSIDEMAAAAGLDRDELVPFFVDAGESPTPGGWPLGGTTRISFPNNHLQYAITWYGLALALLAVGVAFLRSRRGGAENGRFGRN